MKLLTALTIVLAGMAGSMGSATAEDASGASCSALVEAGSCSYAAVLGDKDSAVASLSKIEGRVLVSGEKGFTPVRGDKALKAGDRVILMQDGKATVQAGAFKAELGSPSMVDARQIDGCGCLKVEADTRTFAQFGGGGVGGIFGGGGAGGGIGGGVLAGSIIVGAGVGTSLVLTETERNIDPGNSPLQFRQSTGGQISP